MTNGRCTSPSSGAFPQNRPRASTSATRIPGIRLVVIAQKATRKLRCTAVVSSGDRCSSSAILRLRRCYLLEDRKSLLLKDRSGGGGFEKGDIARSTGIFGRGHHGNRIDDRRMGV